jgi:hypothetical protein
MKKYFFIIGCVLLLSDAVAQSKLKGAAPGDIKSGESATQYGIRVYNYFHPDTPLPLPGPPIEQRMGYYVGKGQSLPEAFVHATIDQANAPEPPATVARTEPSASDVTARPAAGAKTISPPARESTKPELTPERRPSVGDAPPKGFPHLEKF